MTGGSPGGGGGGVRDSKSEELRKEGRESQGRAQCCSFLGDMVQSCVDIWDT